ncbi:butyrophilin subfamily 1 member A1-like [Astatotilapia calliptera]|uniref:butyrophilin subfamily 1 member A1-like n=1 Tax=Astatotilapia calliptera TaxID=8154 RepID=UPI000E40EE70|nr:butyrophilin subfamily 1 member A1-like [Astatotilapia calliptera]
MDLTPFLCFFLTTYFWGFASALDDQKQVVEAGENALLKCCDSSIGKIEKLSWIRRDVGTNLLVFFYRENRLYENIQHPSFRGRVKLSDPQIKDGNVSLVLFNTTTNDTGTYECYVVGTHAGRRKRAVSEAQHVVQLKVKSISQPRGLTEDGSVELMVGLSASAGLLVATVAGFVIYRKFANSNYRSPSEQKPVSRTPKETGKMTMEVQPESPLLLNS